MSAICVFILYLLFMLSTVLCDYDKNKSTIPPRTNGEVIQFSRDPFNVRWAPRANEQYDHLFFWPLIRPRRKRENAAKEVAIKGHEGKRRNKTNTRGGRKREKKREPLTRHAMRLHLRRRGGNKRIYKTRSTGRPRHRHRGQRRRNSMSDPNVKLIDEFEERLENRSVVGYPVTEKNVLVERRKIVHKSIERTSSSRGSKVLSAKRGAKNSRKRAGKFGGKQLKKLSVRPTNKIGEKDGKIRPKEKNNLWTGDSRVDGLDDSKALDLPTEVRTPVFLGKLRSIAENTSETNVAVNELKDEESDLREREYRYDYENVFKDPSVSPWANPNWTKQTARSVDDEYVLDEALLSSAYMPIDDHIVLHDSLATLLTRLFETLRNASTEDDQKLLQELDFDNSVQGDLCQKWLDCKDRLEDAFLGSLVLPACPCRYPSSIFYDDKIWDEGEQKHFRWRDVSGESERLDVYKPGAAYCVRSLLAQGDLSVAAQHCCYDSRRRLLTRGSGAGTPNFVSPEISTMLHEKIDLLPWRLCKGDFSRFNRVRPPNNDNRCKENPDEEEYQRQIEMTKHY